MKGPLLALGLLLAARPAAAQDEPADAGTEQTEKFDEQSQVDSMKETLKSDPGVADSLAQRIARSTLAKRISPSDDPGQKLRDIRAWIDQNPDAAAGIGLGLARDDESGTHQFENAFNADLGKYHQFALDKSKGIFGRLRKSGADSKLMKGKDNEDLSGEEQREILRTLFEGHGSQSNKVVTQKPPSGQPAGPAAAATSIKGGFYDRLSQRNLRGYSPQLQALQSSLNARRAPGAPKLIETGRLDYETLSYPGYGMRFDLSNLEKRLRYERNYALAKALGLEKRYKPEQLLDEAVEKELVAKAAGKAALSPRFAKRQAALEKAAAAIREFDETALAAKDPRNISRALLLALGDKQREAARWITVASLQEELERLDAYAGFMSIELRRTVDDCPIDEPARKAYIRRGEGFDDSLKRLRASDEAAAAALEGDGWLSLVADVERAMAEAGALRKDLLRNVDDYRATAYRFAASSDLRPRWRRWLDGYAVGFLPNSSYSRRIRLDERARASLRDVFLKISMGDLDAAHTVLASVGSGR